MYGEMKHGVEESTISNMTSNTELKKDEYGNMKKQVQYNELLDDINIEGDPYYLKYYRSFHNHDLDTNIIENLGVVQDKDLHRRDLIQ